MKILFLTQFFHPERLFKGLPFAKALQARGHEVEVLTGFPNYPGGNIYPGYKVKPLQREVFDEIRVTRVPLYPSHDRGALRRTANYLSFAASTALLGPWFVRRPDVIYVYNLVTLSPAWRILRLLHGCRVVLDVQDLWPESVTSSGMLKRSHSTRLLKAFCHGAYRSADAIVAQSPGFKRHLENLGVPGDRIDVIYNWTDETTGDFTESEIAETRQRCGMSGRFNILYAGAMGTAQALDVVFEAANKLRDAHPQVLFTLVGAGTEAERLAARAKDVPNVQVLPRCSGREAALMAQAADALLVHLKRDPLFSITIPSKTQAYLRAGRPILIGVPGDASELVREASAGVCFEPENADALAAAVTQLASMPREALARMGSNGGRFYARALSMQSAVEQFDSLFTRGHSEISRR